MKSSTTVSGRETGKDTIPIVRIVHYANEYNLSLDYLFGIISKNIKYSSNDLDKNLIAKNLIKLRKKNCFTQIYVSKKLGIAQSTYSHYENANNIIQITFIFALTKIYEPFLIDKLFDRKIF